MSILDLRVFESSVSWGMRKVLLHSSVFVVMSCSKGNFDSGERRERKVKGERERGREGQKGYIARGRDEKRGGDVISENVPQRTERMSAG